MPSSSIRSAADIERAAAGVIDINAKTTTYVVLACVVAASGGVLFGYDGGITGAFSLTCTAYQRRDQHIVALQVGWRPWNSSRRGSFRVVKAMTACIADTIISLSRLILPSCILPAA